MLVKCKIKEYPDGSKMAYIYNNEYVKGVSDTTSDSLVLVSNEKTDDEIEQEKLHSQHMNLMRTKSRIKDYCLSNDFDMFWTLTFGSKRDSDELCFKRMSNWLEYMKKKYGLFDYIFIPERHKDGCIHFHGVTGRFKGVMNDSGKKERGHIVYNAADWKHGFSTVTVIRDSKKTASYITKYITKELTQEIVGKGKKKYWSSRGLRKPVESYFDYNPYSGQQPDWENKNVQIFNIE